MNEKNLIPVFFASDDRYAPYLAVALRSLIENSSEENYYKIYVLIDSFSRKNSENLKDMEKHNVSVEFVNVSNRLASIGTKLTLRDYYSCATYYRIFIADMFPEYKKALYLDCDIVLTRDVAELYGTELGDGEIVAAISEEVITDIPVFSAYSEKALGIDRYEYFNAGILLMDLEKMREIHLERAFGELMDRFTFRVAQDQDYLNVLCNGSVKYLPLFWNKTAFPDAEKFGIPAIVHFKLNYKPWRYKGIAFEDIFWHYAAMTPYYEEMLNGRENYSEEEINRDNAQYVGLMALAEKETAKAELSCEPLPAEYSLLLGVKKGV